jgi:membrane protein
MRARPEGSSAADGRAARDRQRGARITWRDWIKIPYEAAWRLVMKDEGLELSGYIAFTAFFSLFPFLIFLAALAGFLGDSETADDFNAAMFEFMPPDVAETLAPAVREVIGSRQGGLLTIGILTTLWFASNGIEALRTGLNRAYGVSEERAMWRLRMQSVAFVIAGGFIIFFLSLAVLLGPLIWRVLGPAIDDVLATELVFVSVRYLVATFLLWGALMLLHRWLPNTKQAYSRVLPGVCVSTVLWLVVASLFSWYIGHLADYSAFYGSLGGVAITLFFFYISAIIFIFGAELNAVWRERTGRGAAPQDVDGEGEEKVG